MSKFCFVVLVGALAWVAASSPSRAQRLDFHVLADANGNGSISVEEYESFCSFMWRVLVGEATQLKVNEAPEGMRSFLRTASPDAQGFVERESFLENSPRGFRRADANRDGVLTIAELRTAHPARLNFSFE